MKPLVHVPRAAVRRLERVDEAVHLLHARRRKSLHRQADVPHVTGGRVRAADAAGRGGFDHGAVLPGPGADADEVEVFGFEHRAVVVVGGCYREILRERLASGLDGIGTGDDGDMVGGDFPAWLADLMGTGLTTDLTDTRGECVYAACAHYGKCFIERSQRRAKHAEIVVANHALVMIQAALGGIGSDDMGGLPLRYVFDEGHHIFSAADGAFSAHLSGFETADLRRWLVGAEEGQRSRSRGLKARIEDLISDDDKAQESLDAVLAAARAAVRTVILPADNENDLMDVPENVRDNLEFHFVKRMDELVPLVLKASRLPDAPASPPPPPDL